MEGQRLMKILIVSFYFPPYSKVGGRRWAKHCKYLYKSDIYFKVIAGDFDGASPWDRDIKLFEDRIIRVPIIRKNRPFHIRKLPKTILEKIYWKASYIIWEIRKPRLKGNYMDVSVGNEERFYNTTREILGKEKFDIVLLSGGPFLYSKMIPDLRKQFSDVKYVMDYRDYWEDAFTHLSSEQIRSEKELQNKVVKDLDLIITPNEEMSQHFNATFNKNVYTLPHCYDPEDLNIDQAIEKKTQTIKVVYGGAFYRGIEKQLYQIKQLLDLLNDNTSTSCDFYVSIKGFESELLHPLIKRHDYVMADEYFNIVIQADYVLLILADDRVNAMSSKFFELVALRKPILYFGGKGLVSEFLLSNNLGFHITDQNITVQSKAILKNLQSKEIPDLSYDISKHSFEYQTKLLIRKLETVNCL